MHVMFCHIGREHLGIEYLSSVLKKEGHKVDLAYDPGYFSLQDNTIQNQILEKLFSRKNEVIQRVVDAKPDIVAISVYTESFLLMLNIAQEIKKRINTTMIFGGAHATLVPDKVIAHDVVDIVVIGEGEDVMPKVVKALEDDASLAKINNICYKENGKVITNPFVPNLLDLEDLPYPDKDLFAPYLKYSDDYLTLASRGCPYSCTFCSESAFNEMTKNKNYRQRSIPSMISELRYMHKKYNIKEVIFFDNIFHFNKDWLKEFLYEYSQHIAIPFKCLGHVNTFTLEIAQLLKDNNCYTINFGLQSTDPLIRQSVLNRYTSDQRVTKAFSYCEQVGLKFDVDLIFDLPCEKFDIIAENAVVFKEFKTLNRIKTFNLAYYPRLNIVDTAKKEGLLSKKDIDDIENGIDCFPFYMIPKKGRLQKKHGKGLITLYKILPLLSMGTVKFLVKKNRYCWLGYIPGIFVIFIQFIIAFKHKDYRFYMYFKNYLQRMESLFKKRVWNSFLTKKYHETS